MNRLLEMVFVLLNKRSVTARELSERFGVSQRTIYRDIDALSLAGIPVFTEKGKGGGIRLLPDYVLSKSILSEQEQNEILSALQGLSSMKMSGTDQVLGKLAAIFQKDAVDWLEVDFSDWSIGSGRVFQDIKAAILQHRVAEFDYYGAHGDQTHRRIEPIRLLFKSRAWYVRGFCQTRQDMRLFKLTRIKRLIVTDEPFQERRLPSDAENSCPDGRIRQNVALKLRIAPEMAYRVYDEFDEDMAEKQPDGSFLVMVNWPEDEWVYGFVLSFGEYIDVLEPEHIRQIIRDRAEKTAKKYH